MAKERILITGATGTLGAATITELMNHPAKPSFDVVAGLRNVSHLEALSNSRPDDVIRLDFCDISSFEAALQGVDRLLFIRPSALSDVERFFKPFVAAAREAGVRQVTFLSMLGAEHNPIIPHHRIEKLIVESGIVFTFLRTGFFMQNLCTLHRDEIRLRNEIFVPAGDGKACFVDVRDVATIAARSLTNPGDLYTNRSFEITGSDVLTHLDMCQILSVVLGRRITYRNPSALRFIWHKWHNEHHPLYDILARTMLYTSIRFSRTAQTSQEAEYLLGRPPITFRQFVNDYRESWMG
ncbi:SDR family oxidoreductase [Spirosoma sp. SC4-14]|uniref:SDR family oxidoreductase n=1 Tax=Spirosoma sp. SC4-14 TaxID=3128900 RepID=UPI0030CBEE04